MSLGASCPPANRRTLLRFCGGLTLLAASACNPTVSSEHTHPTEQNLSEASIAPALDEKEAAIGASGLTSASMSRPGDEIGVTPIGSQPVAAAVRSDGLMAIVDQRFWSVKLVAINASGSLVGDSIADLANPVLSHPMAVAFGIDMSLWVLDRSRTLHRFVPSAMGYVPVNTVSLEHPVEGLCVLRGLIAVRGRAKDESLIHLYSRNGKLTRAIGVGYHDATEMVRSQLSRGLIGCDEETGVIVTTFDLVPVLRAYELDGAVRWERRIPDFAPMRVVSGADPRPYVKRDSRPTFDIVSSVVSSHPGYLLIGGVRRHLVGRREFDERAWHYVVRVSDGAMRRLDLGTDRLVVARRGGGILVSSVGSAPTLRLLALSRADGR